MIGGIFKIGLAAFGGAGLMTKAIVIGAMALSLLTAYGVWHHKIYERGVEDTIAKIARADEAILKRARDARSSFASCRSAGRTWDQGTNQCQ